MRASAYPSASDSANRFFQEAVRHQNDAVILFTNKRYAAAVASAHKAQELAVKSALILDNTLGMWEKLFKTHKPLTDISGVASLNRLNTDLNTARIGLAADAQRLEQLEPTGFTLNAEYPYHEVGSEVRWKSPTTEFDAPKAGTLVNVALEVIITVQSLYALTLADADEPIPAPVIFPDASAS